MSAAEHRQWNAINKRSRQRRVARLRARLTKEGLPDRHIETEVARLRFRIASEQSGQRRALHKLYGEREKRLFYANLYIGLWHAVHDRPGEAQPFLHNAVNNTWAPTAGYGPHYMWHVGRVHHNLISKEQYD